MIFLLQLMGGKIQLADSETPTYGVELGLKVYNGEYSPEMLEVWLATLASYRVLCDDKFETFFERACALPQVSVPTYRGTLFFGFDNLRNVSYPNMRGSIDEFLFGQSYGQASEPYYLHPEERKEREEARRQNRAKRDLVIRNENSFVVFPHDSEYQSGKEISLTMLQAYREFLTLLKTYAKPGGLLNVQEAVERLTQGTVIWNEVGQRYIFRDYVSERRMLDAQLYVGSDTHWNYGRDTTTVYKAMVAKAIVDNVINFEISVVDILIAKFKDL